MSLLWFDLGQEGVRLRYVEDDKKRAILVLFGLEKDSPEWEIMQSEEIQFRPSPTGKPLLIRPFNASEKLTLKHVKQAFPNARMVEVQNKSEVRINVDAAVKISPQEIALAAAMKTSSLLGTNAISQRVFETPAGVRFIIDQHGKTIEENEMPGAFCLRGNESNLKTCAQGFVMGLMSGGHAEASDVARFVDILYGQGSSSDKALVERVSQMIDSEMTHRLLERHKLAGDGAYREAQALYENAPPHIGQPKGEGAVPLPLAIATQELVRAFGGTDQSAIYIPHLFDGALASMLGESYVVLTESVDPQSREGQMRALIPESVNHYERGINEVVAPHRISVFNVETNSDTQLANLTSDLSLRHQNGVSIVLFPDTQSGTGDRLESRYRTSKYIADLQADYDAMGIGNLSAVMRRKLGLDSGLNILVIGRRYSNREKTIRGEDWMPRTTTNIYDWDGLRAFTNDVLVRVHEAAGHKLTSAEEAALRENETAENSYQLPYQSFSKNGEVELMIPRNLAGSTYKALQDMQDRVGDLDEYVKNAIGFDDIQYEYLAPEQVDAMALMIGALDRGRGFALGDQTGAGKGVTLAGAVAYAWERDIPVIFFSKQDSLFSDFYRDLKKTGLHEKMRPMILNHSAAIYDQFSENLDKVAGGISRKDFLDKYRFGLSEMSSPNIIFTTYSQFSAGSESQKSDWIKSIASEAIVIFDESHLAAGDTSKLGSVCADVADAARAVVYSSATWLKDARQMRFYNRMLPKSIDAQTVADAMKAGGESIQEVFSSMLAQDGLFIRRERDASELQIDAIVDEARLLANEGIANEVSLILQGLQRLCGVTDQVGRRLTRDQVKKLDAAKAMITIALQRAGNAAKDALHASRVRIASNADAAEDADLRESQDALDAAQAEVDSGASMRDMAETENEDFIANGQADTVHEFDASSSDADGYTHLQHINDLNYADLGLSENEVAKIKSDLEHISDDEDASYRLQLEVKRIARMIAKVSTRTTSFGSLLFLTQRTLNVSLQARFAADRAIEKIQAGEKPIIFLEQTFEKRLEEQVNSSDVIKNEDGTYTIKPLTLKNNLREMYTTIVKMSHTNAEGEQIEGTIMDSSFMASEEERQEVMEGLKTLDDMIEALPDDLYCSPIDTICCAIRKAGYTVGEASGRKLQVISMDGDEWRVAPRNKAESKISFIERAFNFGDYDALVGNKAMSTGMSLHASREFSDQRRRAMMFIQVFADINDYIQAIGRADRRGQVIPPTLEMLASGLPSEARVMMGHYDKLRKLLASTTSNRSSRFEQGELPDLFNTVGDISVRDFLQANPGVATRLGIDFAWFMPSTIKPSGDEEAVITRDLAKHTVSRLDLLPVGESRNVYREIAFNFAEVVTELDAQGVNPLRTNVIDLTKVDSAIVTNKEDLLPALLNDRGELESVFNESVELDTISIKYKVSARGWSDTLKDIEVQTNKMFRSSAAQRAKGETPDFVPAVDDALVLHDSIKDAVGPMMRAVRMVPSGLRERVTKMFDAMQVMMRSSDRARNAAGEEGLAAAETPLPDNFDTMTDEERRATTSGRQSLKVTPSQVVNRRKLWLEQNLSHFMPGSYVSYSPPGFAWQDHKVFRGVVIELNTPPKGRETNLSRWSIMVQCPGYNKPHRFTFQELYKGRFIGLGQWLPSASQIHGGLFERDVAEEFDGFADKVEKENRFVLRGNLFRAASIANQHRIGAGGVLQLKNEPPQRVITVRKGMRKEDIYASVPVEISADESTALFARTWKSLNRPANKGFKAWADFLGRSLNTRGIHGNPDPKLAPVSIYWVATKSSFIASIDLTEEERAAERENELANDVSKDLLAGIGVRINRSFTAEHRKHFVTLVNEAIGYEAVKAHAGRADSNSTRYVVRFTDPNGERDTEDAINRKIVALTRLATEQFQIKKYFTSSPEMRLLSMSVSAQTRANARALRDASDEDRNLRLQMTRMNVGEQDEEQADEDDEAAREVPALD